jgi:hypothetical protein
MTKFIEVVKTTNPINPESTKTSIFDRFKGIVEEKEEVKNPIVNKNKNVEKLKKVFKEYLDWFSYNTSLLLRDVYIKALELIKEKGINCTSKEIEEFSIELRAFEDHEEFEYATGVFLSALINSSGDKEFVIHTKHLKKKIKFLGYNTTKNIVIEGDTGDYVGYGMNEGGSITVNGDARDWVGEWMVKGSKIYLNGNYGIISLNIGPGGKIYHKGKLIRR